MDNQVKRHQLGEKEEVIGKPGMGCKVIMDVVMDYSKGAMSNPSEGFDDDDEERLGEIRPGDYIEFELTPLG